MTKIFLHMVNMSISAGWIVIAVILLRLLLKKAPKWITVLLWGIVAVKLICPFSFESTLSLIPSAETLNANMMMNHNPTINTGISPINNTINPIIYSYISSKAADSVNPLEVLIPTLSLVWLAGIAVMLIYAAISYYRLHKKVRTAVLMHDNIFQSEAVISPFILGTIKPKIYLPFNINEADIDSIIKHEQAHIQRKDYWWKPLGFLLLTLYWFNPLIWVGYVFLCRDIELACDERVIKTLTIEEKADYSQTLLMCSINRRLITACPVAFGEVGVKTRIKSILSYKKPAFWLVLVAIVISIITAICFLTSPKKKADIFTVKNAYTNHEKIEITVTQLNVGDKTCNAVLKWNNQTGECLECNEKFSIYKKVFNKTVECKIDSSDEEYYSYFIYSTGYSIRFMSFNGVEITDKCDYVIEFNFTVDNDSKIYTAYIEFSGEAKGKAVNSAENPILTAVNEVDVNKLAEKLPMYFNLPTENGLNIYVWQMDKSTYYFGTLPTNASGYSNEELWKLGDSLATLDEIKAILSTYSILKSDVHIIPIQKPTLSYTYITDEEYRNKIADMLWFNLPVLKLSDSPVFNGMGFIDSTQFDIDGDGEKEYCELFYGPTSGLFSLSFYAWKNGNLINDLIFQDTFISESGNDVSLTVLDNELKILVKSNGIPPLKYYYPIRNSDGEMYIPEEPDIECDPKYAADFEKGSRVIAENTSEYDEYGINMTLNFKSMTDFDIIVKRGPHPGNPSSYNVSTYYNIYAVTDDGNIISVRDYMHCLGVYDYTYKEHKHNKFSEDHLPYDGCLTYSESLNDVFGELPVGNYILTKSVSAYRNPTFYSFDIKVPFSVVK